jgi:hypothetical protein
MIPYSLIDDVSEEGSLPPFSVLKNHQILGKWYEYGEKKVGGRVWQNKQEQMVG